MRLKLFVLLVVLILSPLLLSFRPAVSDAALCGDYFDCNAKIEETKRKINELANQADSLAKQISYLGYQIQLSQLEIEAKGAEIEILSVDIDDLTQRLERIALSLELQEQIFVARARSAYITDRLSSFDIALGSGNLDEVLHRVKYLQVLETQDIEVLEQMRDTREMYDEQKATLEGKKVDVEELKAQVEAHKIGLASQQESKNQLLAITKGEEAQYKQYLGMLEAEQQAILEALRSGGTHLGRVNKGDRVARQGNTGCSTGSHIHYSVHRTSDLAPYNPCGYVSVVGGICNSGSYPSYGPGLVVSGAFHRPASSSNRLTQSYWAGHRALDMVSHDGWVYASESGEAYLAQDPAWFAAVCRGWGYPYNSVGYGIRIDHGNGTTTSYWHIQP